MDNFMSCHHVYLFLSHCRETALYGNIILKMGVIAEPTTVQTVPPQAATTENCWGEMLQLSFQFDNHSQYKPVSPYMEIELKKPQWIRIHFDLIWFI